MNAFEKLVKIFGEFPGIGPRQARRFVYFLLSRSSSYLGEFTNALGSLKSEVKQCKSCFRFFVKEAPATLCSICLDEERDHRTLMLVAKDTDISSVERSSAYKGYYFVIGGLIPVLEKNPESRIRTKALLDVVDEKTKKGLNEIIIAFNANNDGENTALFIEKLLENRVKTNKIKITHLGRGLSTGSELEYADSDTLKAALENKR